MKIITRKEAQKLGLRHYFTGIKCKNGHIEKRLTSSKACTQCSRDRSREDMRKKRQCPNNREKMKAQWRDWYHNGNQKKRVENSASWRSSNPDAVRGIGRRSSKKFRSTPEGKAYCFAVKCLQRCRTNKTDRTFGVLGYTKEQLVKHIEKQFSHGMSWGNYGDWHIDHIHPVSAFISAGETDPAVINALTNLQPLWASENIRKSAKTGGE